MPPRRKRNIQKSGNAGNSKKGSKEEVKALQAQKKAAQQQQQGGAGASSSSSSSSSTRKPRGSQSQSKKPNDGDEGGFNIWGSAPEPEPGPKSKTISVNCNMDNWTGKRPETLLSELCRQRKYSRPKIRPIPRDGGFICKINLYKTDPKTNEQEDFYTCDKRVYSTKQEAVNMNAVVCLHRINFDKPMHRVLPPGYREHWLRLEDERKADLRSRSTKGSRPVDPFQHRKEVAQRREQRDVTRRRRQRDKKMDPKFSYPAVTISENLRRRIEAAVKRVMVYSEKHGLTDATSKLSLAGSEEHEASSGKGGGAGAVVAGLQKQGFLKANIQEALLYCKTRAEVLDWLCIHLPERDLPEQYRPTIVDVRTQTHDTAALAHEPRIRRLVDLGFKRDHAEAMLLQSEQRELDALARLLANLQLSTSHSPSAKDSNKESNLATDEAARERFVKKIYPWVYEPPKARKFDPDFEEQMRDEMSFMQHIFEGNCSIKHGDENGDFFHRISIAFPDIKGVPGTVTLRFLVPVGCQYPAHKPLLLVTADKLPANVALTMTKDANLHADEFEGDVLMNDLASWVELHAPDYADNPPLLAQLPAYMPLAAKQTQGKAMPASSRTVKKQGGRDKGRHSGAGMARIKRKRNQKLDTQLQSAEEELRSTANYDKMLRRRRKLPSYRFRDKILDTIACNQVVIIGGETGCGKTTQVPQFVLEELLARGDGSVCNIICTQPRRLSAVAVSTRVAQERAQNIGSDVGYKIRLKTRASNNTRLLFCTTGVLLRQLQSDPAIHNLSHVFVDEVHERSLDSDVLLARLRDVVRRRSDLKVVLMSATIDADRFSQYFGGAPVITIPGFTHPVKELYLEDLYARLRPRMSLPSAEKAARSQRWTTRAAADEEASGLDEETLVRLSAVDAIDYKLIAAIVDHILHHGDDGAILVFMPGMGEINRTVNAIAAKCGGKVTALPLHSSLTAKEQSRIFDPAPKGTRKVIVSTNIAETSITVDDVTHVVDSGKMKENRYDAEAGMELLVETWVSRASAQQRRGRAGRVKPGTCYRCFTRRRFQHMDEQQTPEVLRVPLEHLCLHIKSIGHNDVQKFLSSFLDTPDASSVGQALGLLHSIGALDSHGHITALGQHLAQFPLGTRLAKLILFGSILKCLDPVITIAACVGYKPIFVSPLERRDEAKRAKLQYKTCASDHITIVNAFNAAVDVLRSRGMNAFVAFCSDNFLSHKTIAEILDLRVQYYMTLQELGFAPDMRHKKTDRLGPDELNTHSEDTDVVMAAVFAGLYPNVVRAVLPRGTYTKVEGGTVRKDDEAKAIRLFPKETGRVFFHPSSILFDHTKFNRQYLVFTEKVKTSKVFIKDVSLVSTLTALLFSGDIKIDHDNGLLLVDDWMKFKASARVGVLASKLKAAFEALLAVKLDNPLETIEKQDVFELFCELIESDNSMWS